MLLSRLAWKFYWIGCNMQRAEDNARAALAQRTITNRLGQDTLPLARMLLEVLENRPQDIDNEVSCLRHMLSDKENPLSAVSSFALVDIDLRSARGYVPGEAQQRLRSLRQRTRSFSSAGPNTFQANLEAMIRDTLSFAGVMSTGMFRDEAYLFWQVGRQLAAAEMTCAIVRASMMCGEEKEEDTVTESVLWVQVLSALGMLDAFHLFTTDELDTMGALRFAIGEQRIGHSVAASLTKASRAAAVLPGNSRLLTSLSRCRRHLDGREGIQSNPHKALPKLEAAINHAMLTTSRLYFPDL